MHGLPALAARIGALIFAAGAMLSACQVAGSPQAFADAVLTYLEWTPERRRELALDVDFSSLSWDRTLAPVHDILAQAALRA